MANDKELIPFWLFTDLGYTKVPKHDELGIYKDEIISKVKVLRNLGYTNSFIGEQFRVKGGTISNWYNGKTRPNNKLVSYYNTFIEDFAMKDLFFREVAEREQSRMLLKNRKYIGEYITKDNRIVDRKIYKVNISDREDFWAYYQQKVNSAMIEFNKKDHIFYYTGIYMHYIDNNGLAKNFGIQSVSGDLESVNQDFFNKMENFFNRPYVEYWLITEFWIAGTHYLPPK